MRVTLNFCGQNRSLLFDLGMIIIFREVSGVDLIADGDKRDDILIAKNVFSSAYIRACQEDEIPEELDAVSLKRAFLRFTMFEMTKIMAAFHSIMSLEKQPEEPGVEKAIKEKSTAKK